MLESLSKIPLWVSVIPIAVGVSLLSATLPEVETRNTDSFVSDTVRVSPQARDRLQNVLFSYGASCSEIVYAAPRLTSRAFDVTCTGGYAYVIRDEGFGWQLDKN